MRHARTVLVEANSGVPLAGGIACAGLAVFLGVVGKPDALTWGDRTTLAALMCVFTVPILSGTTAIQAGIRARALATLAAATSRGPQFPALVTFLAGVSWATVIAGMQIASAILFHPPFAHRFTAAMSIPLIVTWLLLLAGVAVGSLVGSRLRGYGWGVGLAAVAFVVLYGSTYLPAELSQFAPVDGNNFFTSWNQPTAAPWVLHGGICLVLTLTAAMLLRGRYPRGIVVGVAVGCLVALIGGLFAIGPQRVTPQSLAGQPDCVGDQRLRICGWPGAENDVRAMHTALAKAIGVVGGLWKVPQEFAQTGLPEAIRGRRVWISHQSPDALQLDAIEAVLPNCADQQVRGDLSLWLGNRLQPGWSPGSEHAKIAAADNSIQRSWVERQLARGNCA